MLLTLGTIKFRFLQKKLNMEFEWDHPKFIWTPCARLYSLAENPQLPHPQHLGSYMRALLVSQETTLYLKRQWNKITRLLFSIKDVILYTRKNSFVIAMQFIVFCIRIRKELKSPDPYTIKKTPKTLQIKSCLFVAEWEKHDLIKFFDLLNIRNCAQ